MRKTTLLPLFLVVTVSLATNCPSGKYQFCPSSGPCFCKNCFPGTFCPGDNENYPCPCGTFANVFAAVRCEVCLAGTYSPGNSSAECVSCPAVDPDNKCRCVTCPAGQFKPASTNLGCSRCPAGTFNTITGSMGIQSCTLCPAGSFQLGLGSLGCSKCPKGTHSTESGSSECTRCQRGTYSADEGSAECAKCPSGTVGLFHGSASCMRMWEFVLLVFVVAIIFAGVVVVIVAIIRLTSKANGPAADLPKPGKVPKSAPEMKYGDVPEQKA